MRIIGKLTQGQDNQDTRLSCSSSDVWEPGSWNVTLSEALQAMMQGKEEAYSAGV